MLVTKYLGQAFKTEFAMLAKINSTDSGQEGLLFSLSILAAQFTPFLLSVPMPSFEGKQKFFICYAITLGVMVLVSSIFRKQICELIGKVEMPVPMRSRLALSAFLLASTVIFVWLSKVSFLLTCFAYLALGAVPLSRFCGVHRIKGDRGH